MRRAIILMVLLLLAPCFNGLAKPEEQELAYDDGTWEDHTYHLSRPPLHGVAVLFTPPSPTWILTKVKIAAACDQGDEMFTIVVCDLNGKILFKKSYRHDVLLRVTCLHLKNIKWVVIDIPDVRITGEFYLCVFYDGYDLTIGVDTDTPIAKRSYPAILGEVVKIYSEPFQYFDLCIRAIGMPAEGELPEEAPLTLESLKRMYNELKKRYDNLVSEHERLKTKYESLKKSYDSLKVSYDRLKKEYEEYKKEGEVLRIKVSELEHENELYKKQLAELRTAFNILVIVIVLAIIAIAVLIALHLKSKG